MDADLQAAFISSGNRLRMAKKSEYSNNCKRSAFALSVTEYDGRFKKEKRTRE